MIFHLNNKSDDWQVCGFLLLELIVYVLSFSLLRAQCYGVLNSSVNGLMGFLKHYKLSQLAYRGHSAGYASVPENIINPSTSRRPITGFIDLWRVSD